MKKYNIEHVRKFTSPPPARRQEGRRIYLQFVIIRVRGGETRRRTAYKNPWARWLRWAAIVAISVVVSVSVVPGGWVAGRWPKMLNE